MSETWPPFCQSSVAATVSRFQRNDGEKPITKSGLKSPAIVSAIRKTLHAESPGPQGWPPTVAVARVPIGRIWPAESSGTLPQIHVVRPPGLMKFRPNAAPNEPGAGNRADGRFSIVCVFFANVTRMLKSMSRCCTGNAVNASSRPLLRSSPPLIVRFAMPAEGIVAGWSSRSVILRLYQVPSNCIRLLRN